MSKGIADRARLARQGRLRIDPVFDQGLDRFERAYGFRPVWVEVTGTTADGTPKVSVVLDRTAQYDTFGVPGRFAFDERKRAAVAHLLRLHGRRPVVTFGDLERWEKWRTLFAVTPDEMREFEASLGLGDAFWCTWLQPWGPPVVFVHTEAHAAELRDSRQPDRWADTWFELQRRHDDLGYVQRSEITIPVDSKERFDTQFGGSWRAYCP